MVSATEASIGILYKHYMDNNEDADFKDRHICIFNGKNKYLFVSSRIDILSVHLHSYYSMLNV